ncbi:tyrosine-type recombinase/integrase [Paraliobacillus zengyii]|uniref:tyrosine-type recombinase/integrase n=1 Tax=Paraliobacillus zengyii TaxID=2213194 RepID=UPI001F53F9D2|nr:tyrosine-type recombinase/integrase [Paraliobacillus zengyii]
MQDDTINCKKISPKSLFKFLTTRKEAFRDEKLSPHKLRHTFATEYAKKNSVYDLMRQLGHSSTDTSALYIITTEEHAWNAIDRLDR